MRATGRSRVRPMTSERAPRAAAASSSACTTSVLCSTSVSPPRLRASANALSSSSWRSCSARPLGLRSEAESPRLSVWTVAVAEWPVSTVTTDQGAPRRSARRAPARTRYSDWPSPSMAISTCRCRPMSARPRAVRVSRRSASTWSDTVCIASSRSAVRLAGEKKACRACVACSGRYTFPWLRRSISSRGGRSTRRMSRSRSNTASGTVSLTRMPVIWCTTSFRLSRCWTLMVL